MPTHTDKDAQFDADSGCLSGVAVYDYTIAYDYSSDIGGRDGIAVENCELVSLTIGELVLDRYQVVAATSEEHVSWHEEFESDSLQDSLDAGDLAEAA